MTIGLTGIRIAVLALSISCIGSTLAADPPPVTGARGDAVDRIAYVDAKKLLPSLHRHVIGEEAVLELGTQTIGKLMTDFRIDLVVQQLIYRSARIDITKEAIKAWSGKFSREPSMVRFVNPADILKVGPEKGWSQDKTLKQADAVMTKLAEKEQIDLILQEVVTRSPQIDITERVVELLQKR